MSKKHLAVVLSKLEQFKRPSIYLEQYTTESEIASEVIWHANNMGWIKEKKICDFGAGTGILGIGCLLMGASSITFIEKDAKAIEILKKNIELAKKEYEISEQILIEKKDIREIMKKDTDTIIQNPPFGTKNKGIDTVFLEKAMLSAHKIISMHKAETKEYINNIIKKKEFSVKSYMEFDLPLKNTMPQHRKKTERIRVGCWFIEKQIS